MMGDWSLGCEPEIRTRLKKKGSGRIIKKKKGGDGWEEAMDLRNFTGYIEDRITGLRHPTPLSLYRYLLLMEPTSESVHGLSPLI